MNENEKKHLKKTLPGTFVKIKNLKNQEVIAEVYKVDFRCPGFPIMAKSNKEDIFRISVEFYNENKICP